MSIIGSPITLWTLQHRDVWQLLKTGQSYRVPDDLCWPSVEEDEELRAELVVAYDWMADRLDHKDPAPHRACTGFPDHHLDAHWLGSCFF